MAIPSRIRLSALMAATLLLVAPVLGARAATITLKTQMLHDDGLDKDAYSVLVPAGWKMQGAIQWMPNLPTPFIDISVSNPTDHDAWRQFPRIGFVDGVRENAERAFPGQRAQIEQNLAEGKMSPSGFEVRKVPASPRDYILTILAPKLCQEVTNAKDLKIVSEENLPELAKLQADADPGHRQFTTGRVRMAYTAADGPVEREFVVTLIVQQYAPHPGPGPSAMWLADATTWRAPLGKLDSLRPTFTAIGSSVKVQLPWYNLEIQTAEAYILEMQKQEAKILSDQRAAINQRMEILREEGREASQQVSDRIRANFAAQQTQKDQVQRQFMHYINGTAGYNDPNDGSTVSLDSAYKYHYMSNNGDVLETDDPTLSPPIDPRTSWKQMDRTND